jgi:hypothetical protein
MTARLIPDLVAELRQAIAELHEASDRKPKLREFDLFAFRHDVTVAREALHERLRALDDETLALLAGEGWRCFHCGEAFTREADAAEHFGGDQDALAGCQIKGHEGGLLQKIREQDALILSYLHETDPLTRAMETMRSEHAAALRRAEELGYGRALEDLRKLGVEVPA